MKSISATLRASRGRLREKRKSPGVYYNLPPRAWIRCVRVSLSLSRPLGSRVALPGLRRAVPPTRGGRGPYTAESGGAELRGATRPAVFRGDALGAALRAAARVNFLAACCCCVAILREA